MIPVTTKRMECAGGAEVTIMLISDLHIGSSHFSESALRFDLDRARDNNWPILINGDVLDMILWQDRKRFSRQRQG